MSCVLMQVLQLCKKHLPSEKWQALKTYASLLAASCLLLTSTTPELAGHLTRAACARINKRKNCRVLWVLSTRVGTLLLGGRHALVSWLPPFCQSFDRLPVRRREALLLSWKRSPLMPLKQVSIFCKHPKLHAFLRAHAPTPRCWHLRSYDVWCLACRCSRHCKVRRHLALECKGAARLSHSAFSNAGLHLFVLFAAHTDGHNPLWQFVDYPGEACVSPHRTGALQ